MLRLAHRILVGPIAFYSDDERVPNERAKREVMDDFLKIADGPSIIQPFGYSEFDGRDMTNFVVRPPFALTFFEADVPHGQRKAISLMQVGVMCHHITEAPDCTVADAFKSVRQTPQTQAMVSKARSLLSLNFFGTTLNGVCTCLPFSVLAPLSGDFRFINAVIPMPLSKVSRSLNFQAVFTCFLQTTLASLALMNAKGAIVEDATEADGVPTERWIHRQQCKSIVYKIINLTGHPRSEQNQYTLESEDGLDGKKRHIVRGNFATYTPEKPHVSGYVGNMWRAAHMRGDDKHGVVVKDYQLASPESN